MTTAAARQLIAAAKEARRDLAKHRKAEKAGKGHKYRAVSTVVDGIRFASKAEAARFCDLRNLERAGEIADLQIQVPFSLTAGAARMLVSTYRADFVYHDNRTGKRVIEDVKGVETAEFKIKRRHMLAEHGIEIAIVRSRP